MWYIPVRTVREMWRLDLADFHAGYEHACECDCTVNPMAVTRSFYLGWVHGSFDAERTDDANVAAVRADMVLNAGMSTWVH
jgi:hypothetical protein